MEISRFIPSNYCKHKMNMLIYEEILREESKMGTITWIKNNEVETKNSQLFFLLQQNKNIYTKENRTRGYKICIKDEVEVLHFKGCDFKSNTTFKCLNKDTVLIFEDCKFGNTEFIKGSIRIEQPGNVDPKAYYKVMRFYNNESVELVLADNNIPLSSDNAHVLLDVGHLFITGDASKTRISTPNSLNAISIKKAQGISLDAQARKIEITDSTIKRGFISSFKNLKILNSRFENYTDCLLFYGEKTEMDNVTIKANKIAMQGSIYKPKNGELIFSSTEEQNGNKALAQTNFISVLKAIDEKVQGRVTEQEEKIRTSIEQQQHPTIENIEQEILQTRKKMEYYTTVLEEQQRSLDDIEKYKDCAMENVGFQLTRQKVKKLVSSKK